MVSDMAVARMDRWIPFSFDDRILSGSSQLRTSPACSRSNVDGSGVISPSQLFNTLRDVAHVAVRALVFYCTKTAAWMMSNARGLFCSKGEKVQSDLVARA